MSEFGLVAEYFLPGMNLGFRAFIFSNTHYFLFTKQRKKKINKRRAWFLQRYSDFISDYPAPLDYAHHVYRYSCECDILKNTRLVVFIF